jgi:hypothetical protein
MTDRPDGAGGAVDAPDADIEKIWAVLIPVDEKTVPIKAAFVAVSFSMPFVSSAAPYFSERAVYPGGRLSSVTR